MNAGARRLLAAGALLIALATAIGALGAHALREVLSEAQNATLQTAVHYQFFHALGLLALGALTARTEITALVRAGYLLLIGIVLFSGSLYLLVAGAPAAVAYLTPLGGAALIGGWGWVAYQVATQR